MRADCLNVGVANDEYVFFFTSEARALAAYHKLQELCVASRRPTAVIFLHIDTGAPGNPNNMCINPLHIEYVILLPEEKAATIAMNGGTYIIT